jgi:hypothetical protein
VATQLQEVGRLMKKMKESAMSPEELLAQQAKVDSGSREEK